jgi:hypothetical protein
MAAQVPDEVVHEFAAVAPYGELCAAVEKRFGGLVDSIAIAFPEDTRAGFARELLQELRQLPQQFAGFSSAWS